MTEPSKESQAAQTRARTAEQEAQRQGLAPGQTEPLELAVPEGVKASAARADWQEVLAADPLWQAALAATPGADPWLADADRLAAPHTSHQTAARQQAYTAATALRRAGYRVDLDLDHPPHMTIRTAEEGGR